MDRVNMSIAVLPMSKQFGWDTQTIGVVQSSFFWCPFRLPPFIAKPLFCSLQRDAVALQKICSTGGRTSRIWLVEEHNCLLANARTQKQKPLLPMVPCGIEPTNSWICHQH